MASKISVAFLLLLSVYLLCEARNHGTTTFQTAEKLILEKAAGINVDLATDMQRHHLQELFSRYGENNILTIEGFRKLLRNMGIEKVKRMSLDHEHHHHHHNHVTFSTNFEKTGCLSDESAGGNTDHPNNQDLPKIESADHQQVPVNSNSTTVAITAATFTMVTEDNLLQHPETAELRSTHEGFASPNPSNALDGSNGSLSANGKANESFIFMRKPERGSYMYSKIRKQVTEECFNASKLMVSHGINTQVQLTATEFNYLCPAIVNQIDGRFCIFHATGEKAETPPKTYSLQVAWIGGFISISIISFLSLLGVILVPLMNRVFFKFLLSFLVALAVGTLSGDALLHLLPHSHGNHHHHHEKLLVEHNKDPPFKHLVFQSSEESAYLDSTWKGLTALGGLYFMFLVEHLITLIKQFKDKKKKKKNEDEEAEIKKQLSKYDSQLSTNEEKIDADDRPEAYLGAHSQDPSNFISQKPVVQEEEEVMIAHSHQETADHEYASRGCRNKCHSHLHDTLGQSDHLSHHHHDYHHILHHHHHQNHHPHSHSQRYSREELKDAGIATLAWMVIMGDGLHNFSDGLAIGAAFTEGLSSGLSTSVAVFCHELPHELGDFAVLLKAGMTVRQAVLYNALSAMLAYLGMATGILIGHYADNVSMWIFALTAGLFMYVALVDMVPEMLHNDASDHGCSRWGYFLLQNAGILLGFGIMLLISVFEHKIVFSINL
ncbi:zinc transporter ZIP6 [Varanus komodoensis]|uniref:Zinc transporter ZIP6 n=1 Tax=Varanus komodoensis TaxID=61221 RepID=A0A8D2J113_VARKO|nr:zinc transporter ZIP6 [Varanus komodoensis]XP_044298747.1 zinc transporter ZIP6 [Varanus komodoensis]XP_044298748.1 zinc transporter ZIP6 [Varanus komodoensis]